MTSNSSDNQTKTAWPEWDGMEADPYFWRRILVDRYGLPQEEVEKMTEDAADVLVDNWESHDGG